MYGTLDISTSGMVAQRVRMAAIASNIANRDAMIDENGNISPYRGRYAVFAAGNPEAQTAEGQSLGVRVAGIEVDQSPFNLRWDPGNPFAYQKGEQAGYVPTTNVNSVVETMNAMEASRAYEANVVAAEATKAMMSTALRLLA